MRIDNLSIKRFWQKVKKTDGCWFWKAGINTWGYGNFWCDGKTHSAHRTSFLIHKGIPKKGLFILHSCDNRACVNPEHLVLGTQRDNMLDKCSKKRQAVGERVGGSKLFTEQVLLIRKLYSEKVSYECIAKKFNIDPSNVSCIVKRKTWKHIN